MSYILPGLILALLIYGYAKGTDVYTAFISGASDALPMLIKILPAMTAMMIALSIFRESGAMDTFTSFLSPCLRGSRHAWRACAAVCAEALFGRRCHGAAARCF